MQTSHFYIQTELYVTITLGYRLGYLVLSLWFRFPNPSGSSIVRSLALVRLCLGLFAFVPTFLSSRSLATLALFLCLFLPLASSLLFPCARDTPPSSYLCHLSSLEKGAIGNIETGDIFIMLMD